MKFAFEKIKYKIEKDYYTLIRKNMRNKGKNWLK